MRPEIRIIPMTQEEYDDAMHRFLSDYDEEVDNYSNYSNYRNWTSNKGGSYVRV